MTREQIVDSVASAMGSYVYWSSYDGCWLVRRNVRLEGIVTAVLNEVNAAQ